MKDWLVTPTRCVSPTHMFILNGRKPLKALPRFLVLATSDEIDLLSAAARTAFAGMGKPALLKLDTEEIGSVTDETKLGDILLCMISRVLKLDSAAACDILALRCIRVAADDRREMVESEAFADIVNEKKEVDAIANSLDAVEQEADECCECVREVRKAQAKKKGRKKPKLADKVWPKDHEFQLAAVKLCQPPGAKIWYDARQKRYQVFIEGSSCSRAVKLWGQCEAAREVTKWAWTMYHLIFDDGGGECPVKDLYK